MQHLILIGGFGGSGKTTVSDLLFKQCTNAALFHEDHLFQVEPFGDWEQIGRIKTRNTQALLRTFLEEGFERVICEGYVWSQKELDGVVEEFGNDSTKIWLFWLETPKHVRHARSKARNEEGTNTTPFLEQIEETFVKTAKLPFKNPGSTWVEITTDGKTPEEITRDILKRLQ